MCIYSKQYLYIRYVCCIKYSSITIFCLRFYKLYGLNIMMLYVDICSNQ